VLMVEYVQSHWNHISKELNRWKQLMGYTKEMLGSRA
jgi:hypothetical protein